ncbi:aminoacyl-tRNA deacylase [Streptomyces spongiicola]|uniref:Aminoacyl-tRNA deacylase n=1 Tax=Streptomyces spongiicola TaxID=1690221 RepID=A0A388T2Z8_9ACTN|nr:YbaK/EbsC family protein [Streptomyces spongiicola]GBQ03308.1 aminoacyl-tRNA deacylase [Streptomyces spongiicola]
MNTAETPAHPRFAEALRTLGLDVEVRRFPDATRTAAQAADAIGCDVAEIVKSLVFVARGIPGAEGAEGTEEGTEDGEPVLVLMDGSSRVDVELVRRELGAAAVRRADADLVRETTGYAIGGVPPFGHRTATRVLADRGLLGHAVVWAAAGTPHTVFPLDPASVIAHAGAKLVDVRERTA